MKACAFSLSDQNGKVHTLDEFKGKWVVLYFYPKDDTPGCTKEACEFRDSFHELERKNINIVGISMDSVVSHKIFAKKYNLNFPILSDESGLVVKAYEAFSDHHFPGFSAVKRISYLINPAGEIVKKYDKVNPLNHAAGILKDFEELQ